MTSQQQTPQVRGRLEVYELLTQLETLTGSATKLPLTRRAVINPAEVQDLVVRLRRSLPSDINEAQQILRYRDTFLSQAQADAKRLRATAEQEAIQKVSDSQVLQDAAKDADRIKAEAQRRAEEILIEADAQARQRIEGANAHAVDVLSRLEEELHALLQQARRGLDVLNAERESGPNGNR